MSACGSRPVIEWALGGSVRRPACEHGAERPWGASARCGHGEAPNGEDCSDVRVADPGRGAEPNTTIRAKRCLQQRHWYVELNKMKHVASGGAILGGVLEAGR